jgi:hypothetical protein
MVLLNTPALLSSYAYEGTADRHASLTLAWTGTDGRLNIALINFDHLDVKSGTKDTYDQFSDSSPSLAYWGGQYIAWTGTFGPPFINIAANTTRSFLRQPSSRFRRRLMSNKPWAVSASFRSFLSRRMELRMF